MALSSAAVRLLAFIFAPRRHKKRPLNNETWQLSTPEKPHLAWGDTLSRTKTRFNEFRRWRGSRHRGQTSFPRRFAWVTDLSRILLEYVLNNSRSQLVALAKRIAPPTDDALRVNDNDVWNSIHLDLLFHPRLGVRRHEIVDLRVFHRVDLVFGFVGQSNHDQFVPKHLMDGIQFRYGHAARAAPGRPKIDQHEFAVCIRGLGKPVLDDKLRRFLIQKGFGPDLFFRRDTLACDDGTSENE